MSSSCGTSSPTTPSKESLPEIKVNGTVIDETELANELQYHPHQNFSVVVQQAGQALVIRQLLIEEAKKQGLNLENEEEAIGQLLDNNINYDNPDEAICQRYYENNKEKFMTMPLMEVDHILLAAAKDDIQGRDAAKSNAKVIICYIVDGHFVSCDEMPF